MYITKLKFPTASRPLCGPQNIFSIRFSSWPVSGYPVVLLKKGFLSDLFLPGSTDKRAKPRNLCNNHYGDQIEAGF
jgi:hypothetical protein